jgi:hypothetical protein
MPLPDARHARETARRHPAEAARLLRRLPDTPRAITESSPQAPANTPAK